jgi:hypothetical protein
MKGVAFGWSGLTTNEGDLDLVHLKYSLMKGVAFGWSGLTTNEGDLDLVHLDIRHKIIQFFIGVLTFFFKEN